MVKITLIGPGGIRVPLQINPRHLKKLKMLTELAMWPNPWILRYRVWRHNRAVSKARRKSAPRQKR